MNAERGVETESRLDGDVGVGTGGRHDASCAR